VLVKWLLAIPHLLIVVVLQGGTGLNSGGLNGLLVIFAAVALLFTGRYPKDIFELVMGTNRWTLRFATYFLLMRDEYPPFRLSP
jgi:hypothetical protein